MMTLIRAGDPSARLCLLCRIMAEKWTRSLRLNNSFAEQYILPLLKDDLCAVDLGGVEVEEGPGVPLPVELAGIAHHPDLHLSLLLYPHHVRLDQQFVNRPISCQWVIGDLQEKVLRRLVDKQIRNHLHANPEKCSTRHNLLFVIP